MRLIQNYVINQNNHETRNGSITFTRFTLLHSPLNCFARTSLRGKISRSPRPKVNIASLLNIVK